MEHLGGEISLASFPLPQGIGCISSLLDTATTEQQQQDDDCSALSAHYEKFMVSGLVILAKLAADEYNRSVISSFHGLLSKAMAPISADLLHSIDHGAWSDIVHASLKLMWRLVTAPGETGAKLRSQIFKNNKAIDTTLKIANCEDCHVWQRRLAIEIVAQLPMETAEAPTTDSREKITKLLVAIFVGTNNPRGSIFMRIAAGEALAMMSNQSKTNATLIFRASDTVVDDLKTMLLDDNNYSGYRISAAEILEHLYTRYTNDDDYLKKLTDP